MSTELSELSFFRKLVRGLKKLLIPALIIMPISLLISLFFAEKLVKFASPQITYNEAKKLSPQIFKKSDYLPFELEPNLNTTHIGATHEFTYHIRTNSLGYRMPDFGTKKPDEFRILMLGDSMTFGFGVEEEHDLTTQLEKKLNAYISENVSTSKKITVINAAFVDGKSPDSYYLYLKENGIELNPDLIIINHFIINDFVDLDENLWDEVDHNGLPLKISSKIHTIDGRYNRLKYEYQDWRYAMPVLKNSHLWMLFATTLETKSPHTVKKIKQIMKLKDKPPPLSSKKKRSVVYSEKPAQKRWIKF